MTRVGNESIEDELHAGDWPLTESGLFVATRLDVDPGNALHVAAKEVANRISATFSDVHGVYVRGSAIESVKQERVKDVDIVVIVRERVRSRPEIESEMGALWETILARPRCDVSVVRLEQLMQQPFFSVIQLIVAFRACLLVGDPVWEREPIVHAGMPLALRCQSSHRHLVNSFIAKVTQDPARYASEDLVPWMQKRALRLGGILAMGLIGKFSRHPVRCAELVACLWTELAGPARRVARDYISGDITSASWSAARDLFFKISAKADALDSDDANGG
jgi:hypothetical protein